MKPETEAEVRGPPTCLVCRQEWDHGQHERHHAALSDPATSQRVVGRSVTCYEVANEACESLVLLARRVSVFERMAAFAIIPAEVLARDLS